MRIKLLIVFIVLASVTVQAQPFKDLEWGMPTGSFRGVIAWGDADNDGDLDLYLSDSPVMVNQKSTLLFRNDNGTMVLVSDSIPAAESASAEWGDINNDGLLDLVIAESHAKTDNALTIMINKGNFQFEVFKPKIQQFLGNCQLIDYNNDGKTDLLLTGLINSTPITELYTNVDGDFVDSGIKFADEGPLKSTWVDVNADGYPDIALTNIFVLNNSHDMVLVNFLGQNFVPVNTGFQRLSTGEIQWVDIDNDGDFDLLECGLDSTFTFTHTNLYINDGNVSFANSEAEIIGVGEPGSCDVGDYNNDGWIDLLLEGSNTNLIKNVDGKSFTDESDMISTTKYTSYPGRFVDYDGDGRLDVFVIREDGGLQSTTLYKNMTDKANTKPIAPGSLAAFPNGNSVRLTWNSGSDTETPAKALTYNVRVGTTPGGVDIVSPLSDPETGYRRVTAMGNCWEDKFKILNNLKPGKYYWSVQTVDNGYMGSEFAMEDSFEITGTGVAESNVDNSFKIHQSENGSINVNFYLTKSSSVSAELYDYFGRKSFSYSATTFNAGFNYISLEPADVNTCVVGIYFLKLRIDGQIFIKKIISKL